MKRTVFLGLAALLLGSCATTRSVEVPTGPLVSIPATSSVTLAVRNLEYQKNPIKLFDMGGDGYLVRIPIEGLSLYAELREPAPTFLNRVLPAEEGRNLVLDTLEGVLRGAATYGFVLDTGWGRTVGVKGPVDDALRPTGPFQRAVFPEGADPSAWARETGTDFTVLVDVKILAQTGRGALKDMVNSDPPVVLRPNQPFVQADVSTSVQVYDREGRLVFDSVGGVPGHHYRKTAQAIFLPLEGIGSAKALDAWATSSEGRAFLAGALVKSYSPFLIALAPHILIEEQPLSR